jgi:hypothetical protein
MALGEARIEIVPDVSGFEKALTSAVESAMASAKGAADDAASEIAGSFDNAATEAEASLSGVDGAGFAEASAAADSASSEVAGAFEGASATSDAALASVDGEGFSAAVSAADDAGQEIAQAMEQSADRSQRAFANADLGKTLQGAFAGAAVIGFTKSLIDAAEEGARARARIDQIASSMGEFGDNVAGVTDRIAAYADVTARSTGVDDDAIMAAQAKLLTFRNLTITADEVGGAFDRATMAAIDLAAAGFGSAESNAVQLGKALQDPIKGLTALARAGVTFTEAEKERIRTLVESNKIGEAQVLVLDAIEQQVGGTAAATATASDKMRVSFDQAAEGLGQALLPAMDMLANVVSSVTSLFLSLPEPVQKIVTIVGLASTGFYAASRALQGLGVAAATANKALGVIGLTLAAGIAIYQVYNGRKKEAAERTQAFVDALQAEEQGQKDATNALIARILADEDLLSIAGKLGRSQTDLANAIRGEMGPALKEQVDRIRELLGNYNFFGEENRALQKEFGLTRDEAERFIETIDEQSAAFVAAQAETERLAAAEAALAKISGDAGAQQERLAGLTRQNEAALLDAALAADDMNLSLEEQLAAADAAEQALYDLLNATLAQFNSELALEGQITQVNDALGEYALAQADATSGKLKGEEAARAIADAERNAAEQALSLAAAAARLAEDQAAASGETLTAAESARIQRDNLLMVASTLDPNSPLRKRLEAYITQLNTQIPRSIETRLDALINFRTTGALSSVFGGVIPRSAEGGVFSTPQTRIIAEAGQEAVIPITRPARAVELLESSGLADLVRSQGGGPAVMIGSATFASATDADLVAQRVNTALRARSFA